MLIATAMAILASGFTGAALAGPAAPAYSRGGALAWALAHANGSDNAFSDDCTDFVSRALPPGDLIFANWKGNSPNGISHVGIIAKMSPGIPLITQHSPTQTNVSLTYWLKHGGPGATCLQSRVQTGAAMDAEGHPTVAGAGLDECWCCGRAAISASRRRGMIRWSR